MAVREYQGGRFEKIGSEEAHTIETFERKIHGTPFSEPQRQFSSKQFTERRTYGRDENGDIVVKIEQDPADPVRPATPVRPISPVGENSMTRALLQPIQPLHIPRIDIHSASSRTHSPRNPNALRATPSNASSRSGSVHLLSPRSGVGSAPLSPRSNASSTSLPFKKVTKKSRWVSIHDGRPVSPYTETISYEVAEPGRVSISPQPRSASRSVSISPYPRSGSECAFLMENPLYQD